MTPSTHSRAEERRGRQRVSAVVAAVLALAAVPSAGLRAADDKPAATPTGIATPAATDARSTSRSELDAIVRDMEVGREREAEIRREIDALDRDRVRVAEQLVATAARIQGLEGRVDISQARVEKLDADVGRVRDSLGGRRAVLADVLAALQRIGRKPPPAIVVRPEDALAAVRSAILVGALLPELRTQAESLLSDLEALEDVKRAASSERDRFRDEARELAGERARLELLIEERRQSKTAQEKRLDEERRRDAELAQKAAGLKELIARLEGDQAVRKPPEPPERKTASLGDAGRLQPAVAFADARGTLPLPVAGTAIRRWGEDDGLGGLSRGLTISAREDARVISPCDGWIVFSGPFRSYGKVLIINGGGGYHVVLAGMDRIDVELGQFVLAGEPVGVMGTRRAAATRADTVRADDRSARDDDGTRPVLYVEFRKDNAAIDPAPWWARTRDEKVRG